MNVFSLCDSCFSFEAFLIGGVSQASNDAPYLDVSSSISTNRRNLCKNML